MTDILKTRLYSQYKPLKIDKIKEEKTTDYYRVVNNNDIEIGTFSFSQSGEVGNLQIEETFRRKRTGLFALLSILDFVKKQAEEKGLDYLFFRGYDTNPNNVVRLYGKIALKFNDFTNKFFMIPLSEKGKEIVNNFRNLTIKLPENDDEKNIFPLNKV